MPKILARDPDWLGTGTPGFRLFQQNNIAKSKRSPEVQYEGAQRKIARRGTELFVAVGNELRWSEVGLLKDTADDVRRGAQQGEATGYRVSAPGC